MSETGLARTRPRSAADDRGRRGRVVRCPERRGADQRALGRQQAGDGMDPGHLERLRVVERGKHAREASSEHRLPGAGRPGEQEVVSARGGKLQGPSSPLLSTDVREIWRGGCSRSGPVRLRARWRTPLAAKVGDRLRQVLYRNRFDSGESHFEARLRSAEDARQP